MRLSVSTFYLPFDNIRAEIASLDQAGVDQFHVDFMDGNFVENLGMGIQGLDAVRRCTDKTVDVHMMVRAPERFVGLMADHGADIIYIHPEACGQPAAALQRIRDAGCACGLAISPSVPVPAVEELLPLAEHVLVLSVNPGFANQSYLPGVEQKAVRLAALGRERGFCVMVDGAVDLAAVRRLYPQGIDAYVLGNRILLERDKSEYADAVCAIRAIGEETGGAGA